MLIYLQIILINDCIYVDGAMYLKLERYIEHVCEHYYDQLKFSIAVSLATNCFLYSSSIEPPSRDKQIGILFTRYYGINWRQ